MAYEVKSYGGELYVKDIDGKEGIVSGYLSKFGNIDAHNDIMEAGCYAKSIMENGPKSSKPRIAHLWMHSTYDPIGKFQELEEDSYGLRFVSKLVDTQRGVDALKLYEAGVINEHSVGFQTVKWKYEDDDEEKPSWERVRKITEVKLFEGSSVVFGANEDTPTVGVKELNADELQSAIDRLQRMEKLLRKGSGLSDEAFIQLEIEVSQIRKSLDSLKAEEPRKHSQAIEPDYSIYDIWQKIKNEN